MSLPSDLVAYEDCQDCFERAIRSARGVRLPFETRESAFAFWARLHRTRSLMRDLARGTRNSDDPMWGKTDYDHLVCRQPREHDEQWWIYIEPRTSPVIEEL